jgi:HPt (histidine-containing phosphotransfer) domain-containing protein
MLRQAAADLGIDLVASWMVGDKALDVAAGLARIGGSQKRYLELLETFCRDAQAGFALLEKEPVSPDHWAQRFLAATGFTPEDAPLRSFTTFVHALKSSLANIGAEVLSQNAALLEKAGRETDVPVIRANLAPFREELAALVERIGEITAAARAGDGQTRDNPEIEKALTCLRETLEAKDVDAMDAALARLQALPLDEKTRAATAEIADAILTADFPKAADGLNILLAPHKDL